MKAESKWEKRRKRLFHIIEVGSDFDTHSRWYDYENAAAIILNLSVTILYTFEEVRIHYSGVLNVIEQITLLFFIQDYLFRLWTAKYQYEAYPEWKAILKYVTSISGLIDLFSFLPEYLPIFFPGGTVAFRMVRIVRIFRLFRINYYFDSFTVITAVLKNRKQQLMSSVFIITMLILASSLCMYSIEHEAQPEVFRNAFSGVWWAVSSLLTVGYGDIYPITTLGKIFGIFITFLGVGVVAIPTGIISAGFVEQYAEMKKAVHVGTVKDMQFIKIELKENDIWVGKRVCELGLPQHVIMAMIKRGERNLIPRGDVMLMKDDVIIFGAEPYGGEHEEIHLTEMVIREDNPWVGKRIRELDISRHSIIILVKRKNKVRIPNGNMVLQGWDHVFLYTDKYVVDAVEIEI
ncbi:MAG: ion transporter [Agathobacter sp.]|nr:ion transporter [Agathobacter sp.]